MFLQISFLHWLVVLSAIINVGGGSAYIAGTLRGTTKPNRVTWGLWALAPLLGTVIALSSHADPWATVRVFFAGFVPLLVFLFSFINKNSYWKLTIFDYFCGIWALVAIVFWLVAGSPEIAILFAVLADIFAALPTLRKAWLQPETEKGIIYLASLVSVLLAMPAIPVWNITNAAFSVYLAVVDAVLIFLIYWKRPQRKTAPLDRLGE